MWVALENNIIHPGQSSRKTNFAGAILDEDMGKLLGYKQLVPNPKYKDAWQHTFGNEIGQLTQGKPARAPGTNTIFLIHKHQIPQT